MPIKTGTAFNAATPKYWNGSAFGSPTSVKVFDGAWKTVWPVGGVTITNTPANVSGVTAFDEIAWEGTSNSTTSSASSGTPTSFAWRRVSGTSEVTANSPNSATTTFNYAGATSSASATFVCDVVVDGVTYTSPNLIASFA